jgi:hypothetical protein
MLTGPSTVVITRSSARAPRDRNMNSVTTVRSVPALSPDEVTTFLDEPGHLLRLATVDAEGAPSIVPIWFIHEDGRLWFTPRERSTWWSHVQRSPRVAATVDEEALPYRKVVVRADVTIEHVPGEDDAWRARYRRIALRYGPAEMADGYLAATHDEPRALLSLPVDGATTWRMPLPGEDPRSIWAARYYH